MMRNLVLFDEPLIREQLYPFSLTRSIAALRVGIVTIAEKWKHFLNGNVAYLTADYLQDKFAPDLAEDNWFIASHFLPDKALAAAIAALRPGEVLSHYQHLVAFRGAEWKGRLQPAARLEYKAAVDIVEHPYHIFQHNDRQLRSDMQWVSVGQRSQEAPPHTVVLGDYPVFIDESAQVTGSILNARQGPVYIGKNAVIMEGSCIRGPFAMLEGAVVKMGSRIYGATTLGPYCTAGGEIKNAVLTGYSNKSHDGYLGDAVIGEWCNLGANTNCSNLKNNAGTVRIWSEAAGSYIAAGKKCGVIMGDYSRCGVGTMLNTGTVIGISCNVFGGDFPPKHIPSFSWGGASGWMRYELDKAVQDAAAWMELKGITMPHEDEAILRYVFAVQHE